MTFVVQLARSNTPIFVDASLLRSLQFMIMSYDLSRHAGLWRSGAILAERESDHQVDYEAPPVDVAPALIDELVASLSVSDGSACAIRDGYAVGARRGGEPVSPVGLELDG